LRGAAVGSRLERPWVHIFTVKNGKATRFWGIFDTEAHPRRAT
jgi:hypothetical protein